MLRISTLLIICVVLFGCKKDKKKKVEAKPKIVSTLIIRDVNIKDIEFDPFDNLYILSTNSVKKLTNGVLSTRSLPDTVFSVLKSWDEDDLGYPKEIAISKSGTIYFGSTQGIRFIYPDNSFVTHGQYEIGWSVANLTDLAIDNNDVTYFSSAANDSPIIRFESYGVLPFSIDANISLSYSVDISGSAFFLGSDGGIVKVVRGLDEYTLNATILGNPNNTLSEGAINKVKIKKVTQIEVSTDGQIIYFIDEGQLKELKDGTVKIITAVSNNAKIALGNDSKKIYLYENGDLKLITFQ